MLTNHAHFLLRTGTTGLSIVMKRLLTGYVVSFNRRHLRHGPLFQNRFKAIVCQEDLYWRELVRYIHLNPLRAGIVSDLKGWKTYKYGGHDVLMGKRACDWMETKYVLSYFGKTISKAKAQYNSYLFCRNSNDKSGPFTRMTGCPYLSSMCLDKLIRDGQSQS